MNYIIDINSTYFYSYTTENDTGVGSTHYEPRLISPPTIVHSVGSNFYGISSIDTITLQLNNNDGYFDALYSMFINKPITIKAGNGVILSGYGTIFQGYIRDQSRDINTISLSVSDNRALFDNNITMNYYSTATYANLNTDNQDKPIPQMWGQCFKMPCVCLNELESPTPSTYTFKICDTSINQLTSIDNVYLNNVSVSHADTDLVNGTFTVTAAALGSDNFNNVTASATNSVSNAAAIIRDIIDNDMTVLWNDSSYNDTVNNTYISSYYIDSITTIKTAIDDIIKDTNINLYFNGKGVLKLKYFDANRLVNRIISNHEYTNDPSITNNLNEYISSIVISYSPSRSNDEKKYKRISTYESDAYTWNGQYREIPLDTNLTVPTDVQLKGDSLLYYSKIFRETYTRSIRLRDNDNIELLDFVAASPDQRDVNIDTSTYSVYEVLGYSNNYETMTKQLTLRYVKPYSFVNVFDILVDENLEEIVDENLEAFIMGDYSG